ncbi:GntR family transcriptional regulator [Rhodobaculum claviforme]|uniref:GntR family transcriptional regulator n=1 Tax=Rhodobaculum claviforme TaxID=1549854 RepID=A0A934WJG6_9RHOB|nr:GntR family transcriptional regulator [Rhodobaculum claviforme]MBK5927839.1 GntR family transcriptional regulator [Rhodobaculum claviforme]
MTAKIPTHEATYARIRDMVLHGALAPGEAVTIQGLIDATGAGMTPVREALRRLTAEGALVPLGNRRIAVPRLTEAALEEIAFARLAIEPRLVRMAAPRLDAAAVATLADIDAALDAAIAASDVAGYLRENHRFHFTLYAAADSAVLERLATTLWLRVAPSLRVVCAGASGLPDRHRDALAALTARDVSALEAAIRADIAEGLAHVRQALG